MKLKNKLAAIMVLLTSIPLMLGLASGALPGFPAGIGIP